MGILTVATLLFQPADPFLRHLVLADADDDTRDDSDSSDDAVLRY